MHSFGRDATLPDAASQKLLMALSRRLVNEQRGAVSGIAPADMVVAFRYVFAAAAALMAGATLLMLLMEEKPPAGPASVPAEMAE